MSEEKLSTKNERATPREMRYITIISSFKMRKMNYGDSQNCFGQKTVRKPYEYMKKPKQTPHLQSKKLFS